MNSHSKWLRTWAVELRKEGVIGGANTADQAADEIDRLEQEVEILRLYGNKDCTSMADLELKRLRSQSSGEVDAKG